MKKIVISLLTLALLAVPAIALAQLGGPRPNFNYANDTISQIIIWSQRAVTFLMVIATLWFIWTVIGYIRVKEAKESEEKKKAMIRGIIGLAVIVGIWGIVRILTTSLGIGTGSLPTNEVACPPGMVYDNNPLVRACR